MLSVIGLIRFALCIRENIVENSDNIEYIEKDITKSVISTTLLKRHETQVFKQIPFERRDVPHALEDGGSDRKRIGLE